MTSTTRVTGSRSGCGFTQGALVNVGANPPPWLRPYRFGGEPLDPQRVRSLFRRVLKRAKLPAYFSAHSLRHTFASLLLAEGASAPWVQEQLGHASIQLTVDTVNGCRSVRYEAASRSWIPSYPYSALYEELRLEPR